MNILARQPLFLTRLAMLCAAVVVSVSPVRARSPGDPESHDDDDMQTGLELRRASVSSDPDAAGPLSFHLTPQLSFGARLNLEIRPSENLDLTESEDDNLVQSLVKLRLSMLYEPHELIDIYAEGELAVEDALLDGSGDRSTQTELKLRRAYVLWREFLTKPLTLVLGRQRIVDDRQWLYDENLDGIKLRWERDKFSTEFSVTELLFEPLVLDDRPRRFDDEESLNVILTANYQYDRKERVSLFGVFRHDDKNKSDLAWIGASWRGRFKRHKVWIDTSSLVGEDEGRPVRGYAIDAGTVLRFDVPWKPSFTFGIAYGSGDAHPDRGIDGNFQQTGLEDNEWRFNGVSKFKYYGEVVDPELSNLVVTTADFGLLPTDDFSVDLVYHYYSLVEKRDELRDADIEEDLTGEALDIGHEVDLIVGYRVGAKVRTSLALGCFWPGRAFENKDLAAAAKLTVQIAF